MVNLFREEPKSSSILKDKRDVRMAILTFHMNSGLGVREKIIKGIRRPDPTYAGGQPGGYDLHAEDVMHQWLQKCYERKFFDISDHLIVSASAIDYIEVAWAEHIIGLGEK